MTKNVTAIYNTVLEQVVMVVVDCESLDHASYNPPDCIQVPIDVQVYDELASGHETYDHIASCVEDALLQLKLNGVDAYRRPSTIQKLKNWFYSLAGIS